MANHIVGSFTIKITKRQQQYEIQALNSKNEVIAEPHPFIWTPNAELKKTLNSFQDPIDVQKVSLSQFTNLGQAIYQAVFTPSIANALGRIQASVKEPNGIRIKLLVDSPELANLPWEIMHDNHDFIGLNSDYPLVRGFTDTSTIPEVPVRGKLKILYAWANPKDQIDLEGLEESAEKIKTLLSKNKKVHFEILGHATRDKLQSKLLEDYHIFCFAGHAGHGEYKGIFLEDDNQASDKVSSLTLARILQGKHVRLVFLAACDTAKTESSEDASFAESLIRDGNNAKAKLSSVVAMQYIAGDDPSNPTTEPLTAHFFEALASFRPVDIALSEARKSILDEHRQNVDVTRDVFAPVLYLQSESSNLFRRAFNWPAIIFAIAFVIAALLGLLALSNAVNASEGETVARATAEAEATQRAYAQAEVTSLDLIDKAQEVLQLGNYDLAIALALEANKIDNPPFTAQKFLSDIAYSPGTVERFRGHTTRIEIVAFGSYGHTMLSVSDDSIQLWDSKTQEVIQRFDYLDSENVLSADLSPDGRLVAFGFEDSIQLWNLATEEKTLHITTEYSTKLVFSPDSSAILAISGDTAQIWNIETGKLTRQFGESTGDAVFATSIAFSPDGRLVLAGTLEGPIVLWDIATEQEIRRFIGHEYSAYTVAFSSDGKTILSSSANDTRLWNIETGEEIKSFAGHAIAFSPNGKFALLNGLVLKNIITDNEVKLLTDSFVSTAAFSPNGKLFLTGGGDYDFSASGGASELRLWNVRPSVEIHHFDTQGDQITSMVFSPNNKFILCGLSSGDIVLWDANTGYEIRRLSGHTASVTHLAFNYDSSRVVSGSEDTSVRVWNIINGEQTLRIDEHSSKITGVSFSPDGNAILSSASGPSFRTEYSIKLWDSLSGVEIHSFESVGQGPANPSFSPDGQFILSGMYDGVGLWKADTGEKVRNFNWQPNTGYTVAFSPDGQLALAGSTDGAVFSWDTTSGDIILSFSSSGSKIESLNFSPDGQFALSGDNGEVRLWELGTGAEIRQFVGYTNALFSPNGQTILLREEDGSLSLQIFHSTLNELVDWTYANRYVRELTCDERTLYNILPLCN